MDDGLLISRLRTAVVQQEFKMSAGPVQATFAGHASAGFEAANSGARWRVAAVYLLVAELVLLYAPTVQFLWERWTMSVWHNAHGALVPPIVGFLVYRELKDFKGAPPRASAWGFLLLVPALLLHAIDAGMHTQLLSAVSIVVALPGLSLLLIGPERTRAIMFPLLFLAAALPIPLGMTEGIHMQLRLVATVATAWVVPFFGVPIFAEGTTLHLARGALQVSDACSGFSTLYAAGAVACLTAHSAGTWPRRLLVLLCAAPLAIGANILRVISLVLLVVWQGVDVLDTIVHPLSGVMTFALALPLIFWLGGPVHDSAVAQEVRA
jgi:exosortase